MIKKVVAVAAATGGLVLAGAGMAAADSGAQGAAGHSPGVLSGNVVQAPIHVPADVRGSTIPLIALPTPAFGNTCANVCGCASPSRAGPPRAGSGRPRSARHALRGRPYANTSEPRKPWNADFRYLVEGREFSNATGHPQEPDDHGGGHRCA